jgi:hypothetical protein
LAHAWPCRFFNTACLADLSRRSEVKAEGARET